MKKTKLTEAQKKANKAAYDKAYRERKKAQQVVARPVAEVIEAPVKKTKPVAKPVVKVETQEFPASTFDGKFDHPIRTYWNLRLEKENSSCAKPGTELTFEFIHQDKKGVILYRIRRGKRHFYTTSADLQAPKE